MANRSDSLPSRIRALFQTTARSLTAREVADAVGASDKIMPVCAHLKRMVEASELTRAGERGKFTYARA